MRSAVPRISFGRVIHLTLAQFRRMKPKYQIRLILAGAIAFALFIGLLMGVSALFSLARTHLNTKTLSGVTSANLLHQDTFATILNAAGQDDPEKLLVTGSRIVCNDQGGILEFEMNLISLVNSKESDHWIVRLDGDKAYMRRTLEDRNRSALQFTKLSFAKYFPALSRINSPAFLQKLQEELPVGSGGRYTLEDKFDDNLNPQITPYLEAEGMVGFKVNSKGNNISPLPETFTVTPAGTVPYVLSIEAVNEKKSKPPKRIVLKDPEQRAVILFEVGPWVNV